MSKKILSISFGFLIGVFFVASNAFAATPSVVSVKLTGSNTLTVIYSEPVITNSWDYTNFTGNLSGFGVTSISGSGSSVITLNLSGSPAITNGSSGYITIGSGVKSVSTGSYFPGGSYNVTSAQAPILSSVSVLVNNIGNTFSALGSQITLTFSTNESVVNPTVTILGHTLAVNGSGMGPYSVNYIVATGDAQGTINATILFTDMNGNSGSATVNVLSNGTGNSSSASGYITSNANSSGVLYPGNTIIFTLVPSVSEPNARSITGSYNGVPLSWYTTTNGSTYTAVYTVATGQSNTSYPLQISGVSLVDQYGNTVGPFSGSDVQKTITANAQTGPITIYQAAPIVTPTTISTPSYGFVSTEAGTIHYGGSCSSQTTSAIAGLNTVTMNALAAGTYTDCTISVIDAAGNTSNQLVVSPFTIVTATAIATTTTTATVATSSNSSSSNLATQLQSLQSQLAALQSQVTKNTVGTTSVTPTNLYNFTAFLSVGSQNVQVTALQQRLTTDGFYTGPITGYFGILTKNAVEKFQSAHGIDVKGYVGPSTRSALNIGE